MVANVPLTYGLNKCRDLLAKLSRDAALLESEVSSDRFFNFVVTGYSLIDWVLHDPSAPSAAKAEITQVRSNKWLTICGDIANASKHFSLTKRIPITTAATSDQGWGMGRFGKGGWGTGEEQINIELNDGSKIDGLEFVNAVLTLWESFFTKHGI